MKTIGWIILVFGVLSCLGALLAGHSIFGPATILAIGILLKKKSKFDNY